MCVCSCVYKYMYVYAKCVCVRECGVVCTYVCVFCIGSCVYSREKSYRQIAITPPPPPPPPTPRNGVTPLSLPFEAVCTRCSRIAKRVSKSRKNGGGKGIQIAMIRVQAVGLYVKRVGNFRQHTLSLTSNQRHKRSELKPQIRVNPQKCLN